MEISRGQIFLREVLPSLLEKVTNITVIYRKDMQRALREFNLQLPLPFVLVPALTSANLLYPLSSTLCSLYVACSFFISSHLSL
jgi:hypothetical protein